MQSSSVAQPGDDMVAFLDQYGYKATDVECWKAQPDDKKTKSEVRLELCIHGHDEVDRHTHYAIECKLFVSGLRQLEWQTGRRLLHLREQLHDPLKKHMGVTYAQAFIDAPFAHKGAPQGTTARLDRWCKALASSVNAGICSPHAVSMLLLFLEIPDPPMVAPSKLDTGLALFKSRRRLSEDLEKCEEAWAASLPAVEKDVLKLAVQKLEEGQHKLHGIHEDTVLKIGLRHLESLWCTDDEGLLELPQQQGGKPRFLKANLIIGLLKRERDLKSMPMGDVSAAQGDLKHLSLCQLLRMRIWLLDYEPQRQASTVVAQGGNAHAAFMASLDLQLFQQLGAKAVTALSPNEVARDVQLLHRLGVELTLLVAAAHSALADMEASTQSWVWWFDKRRVFFDVEKFSLSEAFPCEGGALEVEEKSAVDPWFDGHRRTFEWNVTRVHEEASLRSRTSSDATLIT